MSHRVKSLMLMLAACVALQHGVADAAVRTKDVCAAIPFPDGGDCWEFDGATCRVGVRGAFLDLTTQASVLSAGPDATVSIESKGVDASPFGSCVPAGQGREGFVALKLTNIKGVGVMTIKLLRPNLLGGRDFDDITFDVRRGTFLERATFTARAGEPVTLDLKGGDLTLLKVLAPDADNEILSKTGSAARVRLTFPATGTFGLDTKLGFIVARPVLNDANGWPTVNVRAPLPPPPPPGLTMTVGGTGSGSVVSAPAGINCFSGSCFSTFPANTNINLTATANATSRFIGWGGDCVTAGAGPTCNISNSTRPTAAASAQFARVFKLTVRKLGAFAVNQRPLASAVGTVTSTPHPSSLRPILCDTQCSTDSTDYSDPNATITLTAAPAPGHTFSAWSVLACGTAPTCTLRIGNADTTVEARFD